MVCISPVSLFITLKSQSVIFTVPPVCTVSLYDMVSTY